MSIPRPRVWWPLTITTGTNNRLTMGGAGVAVISPTTYLTPELFAAAVQTAIRAVGSPVASVTVSVSSAGLLIFGGGDVGACINRDNNGDGTALPYLGINYAAGEILDLSGPATPADNQLPNGWWSPVAVRRDTATVFDRGMTVSTRAVGGQVKVVEEGELTERTVAFSWLTPAYTYIAGQATSTSNTAIERWWRYGYAQFRYWQDGANDLTTYADYTLSQEAIEKFNPSRQFDRKALYEIQFKMFGYVAP